MADLYSDLLVTLSDDAIRVRHYSLFGGDKVVPWADVEAVRAQLPTPLPVPPPDDPIPSRHYSLFGGDKVVPWADVEAVRAQLPPPWNGRWKLWGTADFATWLARDFSRPARPTIFVMKLRTQSMRV